jgi:SAM-dependent methyltransferase
MSSPSSPPAIFDRALMRLRLARALRAGAADFLLARVVEDMLERLSLTRRDFVSILDLGTPGPLLTRTLRAARPAAEVDHLAPLEAGLAEPPSRVADVEAAALPEGAYDLIVSALALQHVDDLPGVLARARRALKPDGLLLAAMVGGRSLTELRVCLAQAEDEARGGASPRVAPFVDLRDLGALAQRAGLALPVTDVETLTARYRDMFGLLADLRAMGATNVLRERGRPLTRGIVARAAALYAERHADADGRVRATFEIVWLSGWAPHDSQQKPLKPGQGRTSLAQALADIRAKNESAKNEEGQP